MAFKPEPINEALTAYWSTVMARKQWQPDALVETVEVCPTCNGLGVIGLSVPVGHPDFGKMFHCPNPRCEVARANQARAWEKRLVASRLPKHYQMLTFETWERDVPATAQQEKRLAYKAARLFVERPDHRFKLAEIAQSDDYSYHVARNGIMYYGDVGLGKTGLLACIVNALVDAGQRVLYTTAMDILESVKSTFDDQSEETTREVMDMYKHADVLAIDEFNLDTENKEFRKQTIETIIRYRWGQGLPLLMTANVNQEDFRTMWGIRTADVVFAMSHWIQVGGTKLRQTAKAVRQ